MFRLAFPLVVVVVNVRAKDKHLYDAIAGQIYNPMTLKAYRGHNTFSIDFNAQSVYHDSESESESVYDNSDAISDAISVYDSKSYDSDTKLQCVFTNYLYEIVLKYKAELSEYFTENVGCMKIDLQPHEKHKKQIEHYRCSNDNREGVDIYMSGDMNPLFDCIIGTRVSRWGRHYLQVLRPTFGHTRHNFLFHHKVFKYSKVKESGKESVLMVHVVCLPYVCVCVCVCVCLCVFQVKIEY
eukprot:GHVR01136630.1.p2 GENE.GHVR01136630.1~~GHVR01136630.1.p2  ORF type:complete len:249 (+),score=48.90 GHVR01136630.1:28-747(+)